MNSTHGRSPRSDATRNREAILQATLSALNESPRASMEEIAVAAGVSRATLYSHFASRRALVRAALHRVVSEANTTVAGLDPALSSDVESHRVTRQILEGLVGVDQTTGKPTPKKQSPKQQREQAIAALRSGKPPADPLAQLNPRSLALRAASISYGARKASNNRFPKDSPLNSANCTIGSFPKYRTALFKGVLTAGKPTARYSTIFATNAQCVPVDSS